MKNKRDARGLFPSDLSLECKKQSPKPSLALEHPHSQTQVWFHMFTCSQCSVETLSHPGLISITVVAKAQCKDSGFHDLTDSAKHTEITEKMYVLFFFLGLSTNLITHLGFLPRAFSSYHPSIFQMQILLSLFQAPNSVIHFNELKVNRYRQPFNYTKPIDMPHFLLDPILEMIS